MVNWKNPVSLFCLFFLLIGFSILPTDSACANEGSDNDLSSSTGAATYSVPIEVPPGRNGIAPNLTLRYNSYQKNGWIGVGWDLDMGAIQRSTKRGVNYDTDY